MNLTKILVRTILLQATNRFPKPDFTSGYLYPEISYAAPMETIWAWIDIAVLVALLSFVAWAVVKKGIRTPVIWVSLVSVAYFGFFRYGCVCSIGAIQNVALGLVDSSYVVPFTVVILFVLPLLFALLFGRVFCAGVCPIGALQELVNVKNLRVSKSVALVLGLIPWVYLALAVLFALTRSGFLLCRFDPFVGIFRLGGDWLMIAFGALFLLTGIVVGRPFCRFLCPYGALMGLFSRFAFFRTKITRQTCINCDLCHDSCPVDAIRPPYANQVKEKRIDGVWRLVRYMVLLPLSMIVGAFSVYLISDSLSRNNRIVRLYEEVMLNEKTPQEMQTLDLQTFYAQGGIIDELEKEVVVIRTRFERGAIVCGAFLGLVIALSLLNLSLKRTRKTYSIDHSACVCCGRCFTYCPQKSEP